VNLLTRRSLPVLAAAALLAACSSVTVNTDWNTNIDFTKYKTYAWLADTVDKDLPPFAAQNLTNAINQQLQQHGLTEAKSDPELYVTFRAKVHSYTQYTTTTTGMGYGYGYGWGGWGCYGCGGGMAVSTTSAQQIPAGNLIVVLVDPKINEMVWRASASADLQSDMEGRASQLKDAMKQMFAQFPPKKGQLPGSEY
jgi:Domain of unknown function (DUF4136)